jgi:hypothetical protein
MFIQIAFEFCENGASALVLLMTMENSVVVISYKPTGLPARYGIEMVRRTHPTLA